ncbi:MAG: Na+/H+ antiporter NhaC family protein [Ruminococcaceae bacterium]|nr:Na+/H+ antiporter NhaC family protein [Oscillospiraceae bacterium]
MDADGFVMTAEQVDTYVADGGNLEELSTVSTPYYATYLALLPPVIAIILALITKEVFSSLFLGILSGALLATDFDVVGTLTTIVSDGFIGSVADAWNAGILIFLVLLGMIVALINKAGGSRAFGNWAKTHVKTRVGAQLATFALGVLIFVDDYFNCLTVGSVMRPVADSKNISRAKLAYLIDATAAPVCMIAPISSWAAAVAGVVVSVNGLSLFIKAIPYNYYSLLTIVMILFITLMKFDYGPMKRHEMNAMNGDIFSEGERHSGGEEAEENIRGHVLDLLIPVVMLIVCCITGMIYTGGFFNGVSFVDSFAECDASTGLALGSAVAVVFTLIYLIVRRVISFKDAMESLPKGFCAMVPAILILCFAWTLNGVTSTLGAAVFVHDLMEGAASGLTMLLPAIIFLVACFLAFATGTSWGTFGILIPIVTALFEVGADGSIPELMVIGISACLAGAVCGDHCSPISDTTIMASAGAQCNHVNHVSTQLPYAITVAAVSFVCFIIAGFVQNWLICLPIGIALMIATLLVIKLVTKKASK